MIASSSFDVSTLVRQFGYGAVGLAIGLESMGLPFPGEGTLIAVAAYAGASHHLSPWGIVAAAATGAVLGDNLGFWIGRTVGLRLVKRYGPYLHITEGLILPP